jgi:hypothetical protein
MLTRTREICSARAARRRRGATARAEGGWIAPPECRGASASAAPAVPRVKLGHPPL